MPIVDWIEVWTDPSTGSAFLLVLRQLDSGELELVNPHRANELVRRFDTYSKAEAYLNAEYVLVAGRTVIDEEPLPPGDPDGE